MSKDDKRINYFLSMDPGDPDRGPELVASNGLSPRTREGRVLVPLDLEPGDDPQDLMSKSTPVVTFQPKPRLVRWKPRPRPDPVPLPRLRPGANDLMMLASSEAALKELEALASEFGDQVDAAEVQEARSKFLDVRERVLGTRDR